MLTSCIPNSRLRIFRSFPPYVGGSTYDSRMTSKVAKSLKPLKVLSLFSGIGGLDLGFERAGFEIVAMVEWDSDCCKTLNQNKDNFFGPTARVIEADITKITPEEIYEGKVDFIIGGPPCQTFSAIGRRAGGASGRLDSRGNLFQQYCRLLEHYQPKGFMFENVRGILSTNQGQDWRDILEAFEEIGYNLSYRVLDTAGYGVAQHRERVILVGERKSKHFKFPKPAFGPDSEMNKPFISPQEALKDVNHTEELSTLFNVGGKYDHLLTEIPAGTNYLHLTEEMGHPAPKFAWRSKFSDFLYKADPNTPVKTIVASMGRYSGPFHWESRKLSIGELLRLQGFPDGYELSGGRTSKVKQIGNSVVPEFAYFLAQAVRATIFKDTDYALPLLEVGDVLSIDSRKGRKAQTTRSKRLAKDSAQLTIDSIENEVSAAPHPKVTISAAKYYLDYPTEDQIKLVQPGNSSFSLEIDFSDGALSIRHRAVKSKHKGAKAKLHLSMRSKTLSEVNSIVLDTDSYTSKSPYLVWDAINVAIESVSPYPSIHELYGHFTEPKPRFKIEGFLLPDDGEPVTKLLKWMSSESNTLGTHPMKTLKSMGFEINDERKLLQELRKHRIDLRTNLTNDRINSGEFRICYPYTMPIDRKSFVTIGK